MQTLEDLPHPLHDTPVTRIRIYWADTDAGGVVYHANYVKFFEQARSDWLRRAGVLQTELLQEQGGAFVVGSLNLRYLRPAKLEDVLWVSCAIQQIGNASLTIAQHAFFAPDEDKRQTMNMSANPIVSAQVLATAPIACCGSVGLVWVDAQTFKPTKIPKSMLDILKSAH